MKIQISDPRPKTAGDLLESYNDGYAQYPIDHPEGSFLLIANLTGFSLTVKFSDLSGVLTTDSLNPGAVFVKKRSELPSGFRFMSVNGTEAVKASQVLLPRGLSNYTCQQLTVSDVTMAGLGYLLLDTSFDFPLSVIFNL